MTTLEELILSTEPMSGPAPSFLAARLRQAAGVTQREAAKALGVSPSTIANWESARTAPAERHRRRYRAYLAVLAGGL